MKKDIESLIAQEKAEIVAKYEKVRTLMFLPDMLAGAEAIQSIRNASDKDFCLPAGITPVTLMPSGFMPALPACFCLHIPSHHVPRVSCRSHVHSAQIPKSPGLLVLQCSLNITVAYA